MNPTRITSISTRLPPARPGAPLCRVADVTETTFARIPVWFTAAQGLRIATLKGVDHLLVEERGRLVGSVSVASLERAPALDPVARWLTRSQASLAPDQPLTEAEQVFRREGAGCLPVVRGGLLVGTVSVNDLPGETAHAA